MQGKNTSKPRLVDFVLTSQEAASLVAFSNLVKEMWPVFGKPLIATSPEHAKKFEMLMIMSVIASKRIQKRLDSVKTSGL